MFYIQIMSSHPYVCSALLSLLHIYFPYNILCLDFSSLYSFLFLIALTNCCTFWFTLYYSMEALYNLVFGIDNFYRYTNQFLVLSHFEFSSMFLPDISLSCNRNMSGHLHICQAIGSCPWLTVENFNLS